MRPRVPIGIETGCAGRVRWSYEALRPFEVARIAAPWHAFLCNVGSAFTATPTRMKGRASLYGARHCTVHEGSRTGLFDASFTGQD